MTRIHIGSDHAGYGLKGLVAADLAKRGYEIVDHGANSMESCDYPIIAADLCQAIGDSDDFGILICGTGIGMSIAANRRPNIRAALCANEISARFSRRHNNANVLCLGARIIGEELALAIVAAFLDSHFEGGRHQRRLDEINS